MSTIQHTHKRPSEESYPASKQCREEEASVFPPDLFSLVAKFTPDRDLVSFSSASVSCRQAALKERYTRVIDSTRREFQEFIQLAPPDAEEFMSGTHLIDFYRNFLILLKGLVVEIGPTAEEREAFRQNHRELLINLVAHETLALSKAFAIANSANVLSYELIQETCDAAKWSVILEAVNETILQAPNPMACRGFTVMAAIFNHQISLARSLLARGDISDEHRGFGAIVAGREGAASVEPLEMLLATGAISDEHRGFAAISGAQHRAPIEFFHTLLASGPISDEHRAQAVNIAQANHYIAIAELLQPH